MAKILAIANQKGGVGKTTTSINLAASLIKLGKRVLLVDLDPQGNTTMGSGINKHQLDGSVYQVLLGERALVDVRVSTQPGQYDLLPANRDLAGAEVEMVALKQREFRLKEALQSIQAEYDFILIDCPPALNLLTLNGLCAAHAVIIPMQCEYYALEGLSDLVNTIKRVRTGGLNSTIRIEGLLRTMFDPRNLLSQQVSDQLKQHFGNKVYQTIVPRNIRLAEAPGFGMPALYHDPRSRGAKAYLELASEILTAANYSQSTM